MFYCLLFVAFINIDVSEAATFIPDVVVRHGACASFSKLGEPSSARDPGEGAMDFFLSVTLFLFATITNSRVAGRAVCILATILPNKQSHGGKNSDSPFGPK